MKRAGQHLEKVQGQQEYERDIPKKCLQADFQHRWDENSMNKREFDDLTLKVRSKNPKIFGLDSDSIPTREKIQKYEKFYEIAFPNSYKDFLMHYGGGYFAFIVVYSLDEQSPFYIKNNIAIEFVKANNFFPIIDFEDRKI